MCVASADTALAQAVQHGGRIDGKVFRDSCQGPTATAKNSATQGISGPPARRAIGYCAGIRQHSKLRLQKAGTDAAAVTTAHAFWRRPYDPAPTDGRCHARAGKPAIRASAWSSRGQMVADARTISFSCGGSAPVAPAIGHAGSAKSRQVLPPTGSTSVRGAVRQCGQT